MSRSPSDAESGVRSPVTAFGSMQFSRMTQAIRSGWLMLGNFRQNVCIPSNILRASGSKPAM